MTKIIDTLALSRFWAGVKTRLNNKADASHSHVIADVASLQTLLDGKANSAHTHTIANVTGLQSALDGKSNTGHTHSLATTTTAGHMSGADKSKLDGIASGANNYSLPTASASALGGVKVGSNLTITDGVLSATDTNTTYSAATTSTGGLMTPTDKVKLDGIAPNANNYAHPANHPPSIITQDASNRFVTDTEKITWSAKASTSTATSSASGLMSATDKVKLDGVAANANNYTLPVASETNTGGVRVGSNLTMTGGVLSAADTVTTVNGKTGAITKADIMALGIPGADTNTTYSPATTSVNGLMSSTDKSKLDGIAAGANNYTHPSAHPASMITQDATRRMVSDTQIADWNGKAAGTHTHDSVQTTQGAVLKFSRLTQAAYNALGTKDSATLYIIVG